MFMFIRLLVSPSAAVAGSQAIMWGVYYDDEEVARAVTEKLRGAGAGEVVIVPAPTWVLFELVNVDPASWPPELTLVPGRVVIPLKPFAKTTPALNLDATAFPSLSKLHLRYQDSVFQPGYCVTVHKLQGVTSKRVIADLHKCRVLVTQSVVVVLSRVRRADHLRLVPGDLSFLADLTHDPDLTAFVSSLTPLAPSAARPGPEGPLPVVAFNLRAYHDYCATLAHATPATKAHGSSKKK